MIHFDTQGNSDAGLYVVPSDEFVGWDVLAESLRKINVATANNLCVISAACFGLYLIKQVSILKPASVYLLIGAPGEVSFGFVESALFPFYKRVFQTSEIVEAFQAHLSAKMEIFHSEKMLSIAMVCYFRQNCMGKAAKDRTEALISRAVADGRASDPASLKSMRTQVRMMIRPSDAMFQKYAASFLIGKRPGVTFDEIMEVVRRNTLSKQGRKK
jgi:hypothetical protein